VKKLLVPALISAVLIFALVAFANLDWSLVGRSLLALDPGLVALALAVYAVSYVGRGLRLAVLLPGAGSVVHLTSIATRHILLAVLLPARTGEAAQPVMLVRECGRPLEEAISMLALQRVFDLLCVAFFCVAGVLLSGAGGEQVLPRGLAVLGLLAVALLVMRPVCRWLGFLAESTRRPLAFVGRASRHLAALGAWQLTLAMLTSLASWLCTYTTCFLILRAMATPGALGDAAHLSFVTSLVGTTGLHLSAVIPLSPLAGVGTWELGWFSGYKLTGMAEATAVASAVMAHVLILGFLLVLGGLAFAIRPRAKWSG
jgi:uncharacterized membrane protein YbhN (UPF0104 family)